jgi:hypothetical protein
MAHQEGSQESAAFYEIQLSSTLRGVNHQGCGAKALLNRSLGCPFDPYPASHATFNIFECYQSHTAKFKEMLA